MSQIDFQFLKDRRFLINVGITCASLLFLVICCDKIVMPLIVNSSRTLQVPNIIGMQKQQAIDLLESQGLKVEKVIEQFNANVGKGVVMNQMPFPNSPVKEGRHIYLTVSKGYEVVTMPDLSMLTQRDAQLALMRLGLQVGTVTWDYRDSIPENRVIRQSYFSGMSVGGGSTVNLVLSKDSNATVIVPALERLHLSDAMRTIEQMNLQSGEIIQEPDGTYSPGTVLKQSPVAGARIRPGTKITLWVSASE